VHSDALHSVNMVNCKDVGHKSSIQIRLVGMGHTGPGLDLKQLAAEPSGQGLQQQTQVSESHYRTLFNIFR
jgi:hypothetical protein